MDEVFDPQDIIYSKAQNLIGENVATITWKPEIFRATHWFRDIFLWMERPQFKIIRHNRQGKGRCGRYLVPVQQVNAKQLVGNGTQA